MRRLRQVLCQLDQVSFEASRQMYDGAAREVCICSTQQTKPVVGRDHGGLRLGQGDTEFHSSAKCGVRDVGQIRLFRSVTRTHGSCCGSRDSFQIERGSRGVCLEGSSLSKLNMLT